VKHTVLFRHRNASAEALLRAWITLDGAIQHWDAVDPVTLARVELSSVDSWHAIRALHRSVMARGAA
jgi:hypothetical protein